MNVEAFLGAFVRWASLQADIRAVALVGSYARHADTAASDVDLVIVARDPAAYLRDRAWTALFGHVEQERTLHYGQVTSLRVAYSGLPEIEYGFTDESWATPPIDDVTRGVLSQGMRVLWETGQLLTRLQTTLRPPASGR